MYRGVWIELCPTLLETQWVTTDVSAFVARRSLGLTSVERTLTQLAVSSYFWNTGYLLLKC
ncbi:hypothetical protein [Candidatus Enterococcus clewellii]|uniref:Uncharacterized protein n=1 Tax=Candidatus Enterococcus clewellii TaxID=1834193 RepID=A0A242K8A4_9ENTE|nr:hypothetical protein [Enterococcus sp. 9E7_DIV0242]OTP15927.1 hypothetical protein A5888_002141 [Enterococcus sp. 9E7_DIV0242]